MTHTEDALNYCYVGFLGAFGTHDRLLPSGSAAAATLPSDSVAAATEPNDAAAAATFANDERAFHPSFLLSFHPPAPRPSFRPFALLPFRPSALLPFRPSVLSSFRPSAVLSSGQKSLNPTSPPPKKTKKFFLFSWQSGTSWRCGTFTL
jgi:hypothetical protein